VLIEEFEWDDANEAKVATHGLSSDEIDGVLDDYVELRNKRGRAGSHKLVGRGLSGALITVIIDPRGQGMARPVNAWPSDAEERAHARRAGI